MISQRPSLADFLMQLAVKRKIFVSYHHGNDQYYYDRFTTLFSSTYDILYDNSLQSKIDSQNTDYVDRRIREEHIKGTSITIVLCGAETWKRKYVDWEIYATLHHQHALLGMQLPTAPALSGFFGPVVTVPDRLYANWKTGYAHWMYWTEDAAMLKVGIEAAIGTSSNKLHIDNSAAKLTRNRP